MTMTMAMVMTMAMAVAMTMAMAVAMTMVMAVATTMVMAVAMTMVMAVAMTASQYLDGNAEPALPDWNRLRDDGTERWAGDAPADRPKHHYNMPLANRSQHFGVHSKGG